MIMIIIMIMIVTVTAITITITIQISHQCWNRALLCRVSERTYIICDTRKWWSVHWNLNFLLPQKDLVINSWISNIKDTLIINIPFNICNMMEVSHEVLTHWGRVTHICISKLTFIVSDNGLSPGRRQAIIWTNDGILLIGPLGTNFSEILIEIHTFSFKKIYLKMSSGKCLGLNVLIFKFYPKVITGYFSWNIHP